MIKIVLFDLGNVILPYDVTRLAQRLTAYSHFSTHEIVEKLWNDHIADNFETGRMSPKEYFEHVSEACQFKSLSFEEFVPIFNEIFEEDHGIVDLITKLKKRYKLGLISNTNPIHVPYVVQKYPNLGYFDHLWWSNEAGVRKPDPSIYNMALNHFSAKPAESVFIDDLKVNIESAKKMGIHGILYKGLEPLKEELSKLGVTY